MKQLNLHDTEKALLNIKDTLREKYSVKELGIFGSGGRSEAKAASDIDLLVSFTKPVSIVRIR
jgi:predicted nucleotidyltransferase